MFPSDLCVKSRSFSIRFISALWPSVLRIIAVTILLCALTGDLSADDKININVRQSDATIRQQLLQLTPHGTRMADVDKLLQGRLNREGQIFVGPRTSQGRRLDLDLG